MFDVRRSSFKTIPYGINVTCERLQNNLALMAYPLPLISGYALVTPGCWCMFGDSISGVWWTAIVVIFCDVTFAARSSSYYE